MKIVIYTKKTGEFQTEWKTEVHIHKIIIFKS